MSNFVFLKKLSNKYIWRKILCERLSEPLHMNFLSLFVAIFGNLRHKIDFDLVLRPQHAYALLNASDLAKSLGCNTISIIEFGVAAGAGLINLQTIAKKITSFTGISIDIYGFDSGSGMPSPKSYKDHPELYQTGDFPMDFEKLSEKLDKNTQLFLGPISETISKFQSKDLSNAPIGFISIDVDYYSSTVDALTLLESSCSASFLPRVVIYLDDLEDLSHNSWCGEQAAIHEFTAKNPLRPIEKHPFLRGYRLFKNARWIDHIYQCHVLDHKMRNELNTNRKKVVLTNPYL